MKETRVFLESYWAAAGAQRPSAPVTWLVGESSHGARTRRAASQSQLASDREQQRLFQLSRMPPFVEDEVTMPEHAISQAARSSPSQLPEPSLRGRLDDEIAAHAATRRRLEDLERASRKVVSPPLMKILGARTVADLVLGHHEERVVTVLFADIRDFTTLSEAMSTHECFAFINEYLGVMEPIITAHGGMVDKYIGDAIMAVFPSSADDAVRAALAMLRALEGLNASRALDGASPIRIGIGLNTGIVSLGTIGSRSHVETTVLGDAVNLGARLQAMTKSYGTPLLIGERTLFTMEAGGDFSIRFLDRVRVKGKHHPESVYEVFDADTEASVGKTATRRVFEEALAYYHLKDVGRAIPLLEECLARVPEDRPAQIYLARCRDTLATGRHEGTSELDGTLEWSDDFLVGFGAMDAQHKELLARINRLGRELRDGPCSGPDDVVAFVEHYAIQHFAVEEGLMARFEYPLRAEHCHAHRVFGRYFDELKRELEEGTHDPLYLSFRVQIFLVDWFVNHTTRTDRHLARFLTEQAGAARPVTPGEAPPTETDAEFA